MAFYNNCTLPLKTARYMTRRLHFAFPKTRLAKEIWGTYRFGMMFEKNSFLKPLFDDIIFRLIENGIVSKWQSESFNETNTLDETGMNRSPLNIEQFIGTFVFLFVLHFIAFVLFLVELVWCRLKYFYSYLVNKI